ncbi:methyl-accepting chemotaxis protein [Selenomonas sp. KH1T6]|uniref:methyl-accepting chemotaxis protein n=1 Tax=Selenomonas sp. KH1T6 TaxID=3158784 RepID=UPI0008A75FBB|nr:methyl-accepting chemotaxis sensory transducer with Cache sensor [Selenomonas ruminantium]
MFNFKSVRDRLTVLFVLLSAASTLTVGAFFIVSQIRSNNEQVETYRVELAQQYDRELKMQTEGIISAIEGIYKEQQAGRIQEAEAKKLAMEAIRNTRFDEGKGYFSVDERRTGICVVHPIQGAKVEGKDRSQNKDSQGVMYMQDMFKAADAGGGFVNYSFPKPGESTDSPKRTYVGYFKPYDWVIDTGSYIDYIDARANAYADEMQSKLNSQIIISIVLLAIIEVLVVVISMRLAQAFADPIVFVTRRLGQFAEGDYRKEPIREDWVSRNDEIGGMMHSIGNLAGSMRGLLNTITSSAEQVASDAADLTERTEQSSQASHSVAVSITDVAGAANNQLNAVNDATQSIDRLAETMNRVSSSAEDTAANTRRAAQAAQNGQQVVSRTVSDMEHLSQAVESSAARIRELGARSDTIGQITDTISSIAEQTNLLALNAAIEAARAGEQGRGFAVVAEEIRKLAAQSEEAASQIAQLIGQIQEDTKHAVSSMNDGTQQLVTTKESVSQTGSEFQDIAQLIESISKQSDRIAQASRSATEDATGCQQSIQEIDNMSKNVVAESENVSAATEEQSASMQDMAHSCRELANMSEKLRQAVTKFKV